MTTEVLVVGGGPAGAAAAYWLARHGHDVTVVERKTFPREKTCGDGLTPRAVQQLEDMGLGRRARRVPPLRRAAGHRRMATSSSWSGRRTPCTRSTATSCAAATSTRWSPTTPWRPGPRCWQGHEAVAPRRRAGLRPRRQRGARRPTASHRRGAGRVHRRRRRRQQPLRPGARHVPRPRVALRHGDPRRTGSRPGTPSRGSSRRSTSRTATATRCPATAGSSRSATDRRGREVPNSWSWGESSVQSARVE